MVSLTLQQQQQQQLISRTETLLLLFKPNKFTIILAHNLSSSLHSLLPMCPHLHFNLASLCSPYLSPQSAFNAQTFYITPFFLVFPHFGRFFSKSLSVHFTRLKVTKNISQTSVLPVLLTGHPCMDNNSKATKFTRKNRSKISHPGGKTPAS